MVLLAEEVPEEVVLGLGETLETKGQRAGQQNLRRGSKQQQHSVEQSLRDSNRQLQHRHPRLRRDRRRVPLKQAAGIKELDSQQREHSPRWEIRRRLFRRRKEILQDKGPRWLASVICQSV